MTPQGTLSAVFREIKIESEFHIKMKKNKKTPEACIKKTSIGGQALMEGIMMRGPETTAMAVINTKGEMVVERFPTVTKERSKFFKLPIVRGVVGYFDSMAVGTKCLMRSAELSGLEEAEEEMRREKESKKAKREAKRTAKNKTETSEIEQNDAFSEENVINSNEVNENDVQNEPTETVETPSDPPKETKKKRSGMINSVLIVSILLGVLFAVGLFIVLPSAIYEGASFIFPILKPENTAIQSLIKSVFEGVIKIVILIGYMSAVSLMKDIKKTFMYHGAEHKAIFCYEKGLDLTVENVKKQKRFHPRCGTSFLILMVLVGIFVSFFVDPVYSLIFGVAAHAVVRVLIKILLLPLIVGIGYELIKIAGRYDNWLTKIISAPGVLLQRITTKEPDDRMIECAITALKEVIPNNDSDKW